MCQVAPVVCKVHAKGEGQIAEIPIARDIRQIAKDNGQGMETKQCRDAGGLLEGKHEEQDGGHIINEDDFEEPHVCALRHGEGEYVPEVDGEGGVVGILEQMKCQYHSHECKEEGEEQLLYMHPEVGEQGATLLGKGKVQSVSRHEEEYAATQLSVLGDQQGGGQLGGVNWIFIDGVDECDHQHGKASQRVSCLE